MNIKEPTLSRGFTVPYSRFTFITRHSEVYITIENEAQTRIAGRGEEAGLSTHGYGKHERQLRNNLLSQATEQLI